MSRGEGKKSLHDVLRARREAPSLLSPAEAAQREAARRREEIDAEAAAALERWRDGRSPDARGKLAPETYKLSSGSARARTRRRATGRGA